MQQVGGFGGGGVTTLDGLSDVAITSPTSGQLLRYDGTNFVNATVVTGDYTWVIKTANESVSSSTTVQDDDHLFFTMTANKTYAINYVIYGWGGAGGILACFDAPSMPAGVSFPYSWFIAGNGSMGSMIVTTNSSGATNMWIGDSAAFPRMARGTMIVKCGATGGTFKFRWAQNSSNATSSTLALGSYLAYKQLD